MVKRCDFSFAVCHSHETFDIAVEIVQKQTRKTAWIIKDKSGWFDFLLQFNKSKWSDSNAALLLLIYSLKTFRQISCEHSKSLCFIIPCHSCQRGLWWQWQQSGKCSYKRRLSFGRASVLRAARQDHNWRYRDSCNWGCSPWFCAHTLQSECKYLATPEPWTAFTSAVWRQVLLRRRGRLQRCNSICFKR